jgi:hypothetical protein
MEARKKLSRRGERGGRGGWREPVIRPLLWLERLNVFYLRRAPR